MAVAAPAVILWGLCAPCSDPSGWPIPFRNALTLVGLSSAVLQGATELLASKFRRLAGVSDALLCLTVLGGGGLVVASLSDGVKPCPLCIVFWFCEGLLFLELLVSRRTLARLAYATLVTMGLTCTIFLFSPEARAQLASTLPEPKSVSLGPPLGTRLPECTITDGYLLYATECAPCLQNSVRKAAEELRKKRTPFEVIALKAQAQVVQTVVGTKPVLLDYVDYATRRIMTDGTPMVITVKDGLVSKVRTIPDFLVSLRQKP
ncbi:MAG TPA: hypothetical protein VG820_13435 [Fimbriimonadaceae bacterium]|nr:hypothetical protein [Fimbriimonadaceae bacterium]